MNMNMNIPRTVLITALVTSVTILSACGGGGGGGSAGGTPATASSQLCDTLSGTEAIYWDFINGTPRADLPSTAFTIPSGFVVSPYTNAVTPLLGFTAIPAGWSIADGGDVSGFAFPNTVAATNLVRDDNAAVWRYVFTSQVTGGFTSAAILDAEINAALDFIGNPANTSEECEISVQQNGIIGPESVAARVVRAGDFTIMARAHVIIPTGGLTGFYDGYLSLARTSENEAEIINTFIPMITQLYGGGDDPTECEDGVDNDGDLAIDLNDPECQSPSDDSESS